MDLKCGHFCVNLSLLQSSLIFQDHIPSTTLIACEQTGRTCFGMEIDPVYIDVIIERWENYSGQKAEKVKE